MAFCSYVRMQARKRHHNFPQITEHFLIPLSPAFHHSLVRSIMSVFVEHYTKDLHITAHTKAQLNLKDVEEAVHIWLTIPNKVGRTSPSRPWKNGGNF